ncbi:protealysin inhibitor emfourin, partial [Nocardioides sp.]|uniref:protealysin inhibitor emfourin n=1 Tax=Nocardioides sp. TaxID=35761 RepID=UPI00260EF24D
PAAAAGVAAWTVHDAGSTTSLPGAPVRSAGDPPSGDVAVDEAGAGIEATLAMFAEVLHRDSHDDAGAPVSLTVHYGSAYNNAFWDGTQLVFGDGDGRVFERFTKPVDVLAHEFSHAVVEHSAALVYRDQSGALNESVADVFASCLKQRLLGQEAGEGDWLIGEGIFTPSVRARALRDMAAPGTAYDDPELGADPQVGHMDDYVETTADNGGVHLNSGIPNKAFQLAAVAVGGVAIEGAGRIWYDALVGGDVTADADFAAFAAATVAAAGEHADVVRDAWVQVGVEPATATGAPVPEAGTAVRLRVERSGGFIGRTESAEVDLDDPEQPDLRGLVADAGLSSVDAAADATPHPDMYIYTFTVEGADPVRVPEHRLTAGQAELARRILRRGSGEP